MQKFHLQNCVEWHIINIFTATALQLYNVYRNFIRENSGC